MTRAFTEAHRARRKFTTAAMLALRDEGLTRQQAAAHLGVSDSAVGVRCKAEGIVWAPPKGLARYDDPTFARLWSCLDISRDEIARSAGVSPQAVTWRARQLGLPSRARGRRRKHDPALLTEMWNAGVRCADIARYFGMVGHASVSTAARKLGLPPRVRGASGFRNGGWTTNITLEEFMEARMARALERVAQAERDAQCGYGRRRV